MNLICDNCLRDTGISVGTSRHGAAAVLNLSGGVAKCDTFYSSAVGKAASWLYYCSPACKDKHYPKHLESLNLPEGEKEMIESILGEARKNIPQMAKDLLFDESNKSDISNNLHEPIKQLEHDEIKEFEERNEKIHFSTQITKGTLKRIRQFEYWERMKIGRIIEDAVTDYFKGKENADKPLPPDRIKEIQQISENKKRAKRK